MPSPFKDAFGVLFSRIFPKTLEVEINLDTAPDGNFVYVDSVIKSKDGTYRITDLKGLPNSVKIGSRHYRVSRKNRQTLKHLADWDPAFDARKGFVFYEKDVPDILSYLRSKASLQSSPAASKIIVDETHLEYNHEIQGSPQHIEIVTKLKHPDSHVEMSDEGQLKGLEGSKFVHVGDGFYGKPQVTAYKTFEPRIGKVQLSGDQIPIFLLYDLKRIQSNSRNQVSPGVTTQKVITTPFESNVSLHVDGPWIWFDVKYLAEKFSIPYQRVEATKTDEQFIREESTWIQIDKVKHRDVAQHIKAIPEVETIDDGFRTRTCHFHEVQSLLEQVATIDTSEAYRKLLKSLEDFSQIEEPPLPEGFRGELRDYQKNGYAWVRFLHKYGLNGILADEMGLGKTAQTLAALIEAHSFGDAKTSLIICPPSVLSAWDEEIKKFTSVADFRTSRYVGSNRQKILSALNHYDAVLTTYTIAARDIEVLSKIAWEYVVLDEAQKIKNNSTATAKACKRLIANHKLALTGTPIENRLSELWSIYDFLMPSYLGGYAKFRDRYEIPIIKQGDHKATEDLKRRISPFKLRRLKSQVAKELPEKILMERYCELTPEQVQLYKQYASAEQEKIRNLPDAKVRIDTSILTAILRLKQICCHPALVTKDKSNIYGRSGKLDAFLEIIDELEETGERVIIFSQFTEMLEILRKVFDERKHSYFYLDGQTPEKNRAKMIEDFQKGAVPFFLISLRAGGLGITLTEASCVIHYDRWWNPAVEDQATDRAHRIGQKNMVKVFRIHTTGTIEERIGQLLVKKKDLFDSVIEVDDLRKEISKEELLSLFAPPNGKQ
jgi:ERCC4-related helicase